MKNHCFVILGMHRSATSLIAKGLSESGVYMGNNNMQQADSGNPHGYWEDLDFQFLNKEILARAGGDWFNIPDEDAILSAGKKADIKGRIKGLIQKRYEQYNLWGFKDPRTVLTIRAIRPHLKNHSFFACFRNPNEVAQSLYTRNTGFGNGTVNQYLPVAKEYNKRLLSFLNEL
jgi:hypothetical protein